MVDRSYGEAGRFQWAREAAVNAIEAGATRIQFGLDWNGVTAGGVYRRCIADDGCGMDRDELVTFFKTLGGSSKTVGGPHENYGIGAKIALLPWNTAGLLVVSWKEGEGNVIWAKADAETNEYGLRKVEFEGEVTEVWGAGDEPDLGFDLEDLRPEWIEDHGTVLLLLGDELDQHTIRNDSRRDLKGRSALREYLDRRFWDLPEGIDVRVDELESHDDPDRWPKQSGEGGVVARSVSGSKRNVEQVADFQGTVDVRGTKLHWFLDRDVAPGERKFTRARGFIAALYRGELYEHKTEHYSYRDFGVAHQEVRQGLTIIAEPPLADDDRRNGVFSEADRNSLLWNDGDGENRPLPWAAWGEGFADDMPDEVRSALDANRRGGELEDDSYKQRLASMFGERFKMARLEAEKSGTETVTPVIPRRRSSKAKGKAGDSNRQGQSERDPAFGKTGDTESAKPASPAVSLPRWEACGSGDVGTGMIAAYDPKNPLGPTVQVNVQHSVIRDQIAFWTEQYPHAPEVVEAVVEEVYGVSAVAAVAHSEELKTLKVDRVTLEEVRSEASLTLALLGLMPHDQLILQKLSGKLGRRRTNGPVSAPPVLDTA